MARLFKSPISTHWQALAKRQAVALVVLGIVLEIPVRWIVRPDIPYMLPGNPWFNLPLRIAIEIGFVVIILPLAAAMKISYPALGIPRRRWTRWEWIAFAVVGAVELAVVISSLATAGRTFWPRECLVVPCYGRCLSFSSALTRSSSSAAS